MRITLIYKTPFAKARSMTRSLLAALALSALAAPAFAGDRLFAFSYGSNTLAEGRTDLAAAILAGRDEATNADLAAWRRLGTGARA